MKDNFEQKAGDNSTQIQAGLVVMNQGIDEKRAREIFLEMFQNSRRDFSIEAEEKAKERIMKFEESLIPRMQKIEGALEAFADPEFQVMLTSAHKSAAITTNEDDYTILSELLIHKIKKGNDRKSISGIKKAIEIVNEIPAESLLGLTVLYAWEHVEPNSGIISDGLETLDSLFSTLIYDELPKGIEWMEQLDVVNAIRITEFSSFKKMIEYYIEKFNGYCCLGIKKDSDDYGKACELLKSISISNILIENELNPEYVRLAVINKDRINSLKRIVHDLKTGKNGEVELLENEKEVLNQIFEMYDKSDNNDIKEKFIQKIEEKPSLKKLKEWIDNIPKSYITTPIGKVLANVNAQRCNQIFPPLD